MYVELYIHACSCSWLRILTGLLGYHILRHRVCILRQYTLTEVHQGHRFSSIVISRFLLNLRQVHTDDEWNSTVPSFVASRGSAGLNFASAIIGNLGEHLEHGHSGVSGLEESQRSDRETPEDMESDDPHEEWTSGSTPYERESTSSPTQSDVIHTPV